MSATCLGHSNAHLGAGQLAAAGFMRPWQLVYAGLHLKHICWTHKFPCDLQSQSREHLTVKLSFLFWCYIDCWCLYYSEKNCKSRLRKHWLILHKPVGLFSSPKLSALCLLPFFFPSSASGSANSSAACRVSITLCSLVMGLSQAKLIYELSPEGFWVGQNMKN